ARRGLRGALAAAPDRAAHALPRGVERARRRGAPPGHDEGRRGPPVPGASRPARARRTDGGEARRGSPAMSAPEGELVPEAELVELFRRRRPDPAAFRARIAQRIAEKERDPEADGPDRRSILRAEFVRRAAAFLPLDPASGSSAAKLALTGLALPLA